jgi:SAM-dependent methyltransferase
MQYVVRRLYGRNILVPITKKATRILDIGAGSGKISTLRLLNVGTWAIEVADEYPRTIVIGLDLAPIQPTEVPENCEFRICDLRTELVDYYDGSVDLIHARYLPAPYLPPHCWTTRSNCRFLHAGIKADEWGSFVNEIYRILKPGGWAQCGEVYGFCFENDVIPDGCALGQVSRSVAWLSGSSSIMRSEVSL